MMDFELDRDELLEQRIWVDEDDCYVPIYDIPTRKVYSAIVDHFHEVTKNDIPTRKVYSIEKKLKKAVDSGASEHVRKWYAVFVEEAAIRRGMTQPD